MRYDKLQTHDFNGPEDTPVASTSILINNRDSYMNRRGRPEFYNRGRGGFTWGNVGRSNSPYQRPLKDLVLRAPLVGKDKQP